MRVHSSGTVFPYDSVRPVHPRKSKKYASGYDSPGKRHGCSQLNLMATSERTPIGGELGRCSP